MHISNHFSQGLFLSETVCLVMLSVQNQLGLPSQVNALRLSHINLFTYVVTMTIIVNLSFFAINFMSGISSI